MAAGTVLLAASLLACSLAGTPSADAGPECDGQDQDAGTHVLRGGATDLPGGGALFYDQTTANGQHREATVFAGREPDDQREKTTWTVTPDDELTVAGHTYTVAQVCTYRVVLTTLDTSTSTPEEEASKDWPLTQDGQWTLPWHIPDRRRGDHPLVVIVTDIQTGPTHADISVSGSEDAFYTEVREGDTVEIAGRLWKIETITPGDDEAGLDSGGVTLSHISPA